MPAFKADGTRLGNLTNAANGKRIARGWRNVAGVHADNLLIYSAAGTPYFVVGNRLYRMDLGNPSSPTWDQMPGILPNVINQHIQSSFIIGGSVYVTIAEFTRPPKLYRLDISDNSFIATEISGGPNVGSFEGGAELNGEAYTQDNGSLQRMTVGVDSWSFLRLTIISGGSIGANVATNALFTINGRMFTTRQPLSTSSRRFLSFREFVLNGDNYARPSRNSITLDNNRGLISAGMVYDDVAYLFEASGGRELYQATLSGDALSLNRIASNLPGDVQTAFVV